MSNLKLVGKKEKRYENEKKKIFISDIIRINDL